MLRQLLVPSITMLCIAGAIWIIIRIQLNKRKSAVDFRLEAILLMLTAYTVCVLVLTLYPLPVYRSWNLHEVNLVPIIGSVKLYHSVSENGHLESFIMNLLGNICLFIPYGVMLPQISSVLRTLWKLLIVIFLLSATIEILQWVLRGFQIYRTVDIDDVLLNTIGGLIGFGVYRFARRFNLAN